MKAGKIKSLFMFIIGCFYAVCAYSATSLFSDYGQIQNVQNYSTNPFWSPNAPYNQKMPQPVYVQGNAVTTDECIRVIQSAVAFQCAARDNCRNTQLTDIRPAIIVQLSNLPGKAYGTACAGYLDSVFESYVAQYGNNAPTRQVAFPDSTIPNPSINNNNNTIQIKNPYEIKTPQWQQEINERSRELQELQSENGAGNYGLSATAFPTTYNDLSFTDRMANEAAGYAPYKDKSAYKTIEVKSGDEWCKEHPDSKECICIKDPTAAQCNKNIADNSKQQQKQQKKPEDKNNKNELCAELTDRSQCCAETNTGCIKELCDGNTEFKEKHPTLCQKEEESVNPVYKASLCRETPFTIADWTTVFKDTISVKVKTAEIAKVLAEELLKCTEGATGYSVPELQYAKYGRSDTRPVLLGYKFDDYIIVKKDNSDEYEYIRFDSINENSWYTSEYAFFSALCHIAGGTISTIDSRMCNNIKQEQCDVFITIVQKHNDKYSCSFDQNSCKCRYNQK